MKQNPDSLVIPPRRSDIRRRRRELLNCWYGETRGAVEIAAHTMQPQSIGDLVASELARIERTEIATLIQLRDAWSELIGKGFSRFTEPHSLRDGVLVLKVRHSALVMELTPSLDIILKQVNSRFPGICASIKLTV